MNTTEILDRLLRFSPTRGQRLWPAIIGETGSGKTSITRAWARENGYTIASLLLGTKMPEDVLGIPHVSKGVTSDTLRDWAITATKQKTLVFLDEIDKARPEVLGTVLTLLAERRIHDVELPPETLFVAAGQPVDDGWLSDESAKALSARLIWIPMVGGWEYLERTYSLSLPRGAESTVKLPVLPSPTPRQVEYLIQARTALTKDVFEAACHGSLSDSSLAWLTECLSASPEPTLYDLVVASGEPSKILDAVLALTQAEASSITPSLLLHGPGYAWLAALLYSLGGQDSDIGKTTLKTQFEETQAALEALPEKERYIFGNEPGDNAYLEAMVEAASNALSEAYTKGTVLGKKEIVACCKMS